MHRKPKFSIEHIEESTGKVINILSERKCNMNLLHMVMAWFSFQTLLFTCRIQTKTSRVSTAMNETPPWKIKKRGQIKSKIEKAYVLLSIWTRGRRAYSIQIPTLIKHPSSSHDLSGKPKRKGNKNIWYLQSAHELVLQILPSVCSEEKKKQSMNFITVYSPEFQL